MPFLGFPSIFGFIAVILFLVMAGTSYQNEENIDTILWTVPAVAYFWRNIPKFIIFSFINIFAYILLIIGAGGIIIFRGLDLLDL